MKGRPNILTVAKKANRPGGGQSCYGPAVPKSAGKGGKKGK